MQRESTGGKGVRKVYERDKSESTAISRKKRGLSKRGHFVKKWAF